MESLCSQHCEGVQEARVVATYQRVWGSHPMALHWPIARLIHGTMRIRGWIRGKSSPLDLGTPTIPKGSTYHYSRYLVGIWAPKVYTILLLGPFGSRSRKIGVSAQRLAFAVWGFRGHMQAEASGWAVLLDVYKCVGSQQ